MMSFLNFSLAAAVVAGAAAGAAAQSDEGHHDMMAHDGATMAEGSASYTLQTPIAELMADEEAKAVVLTHFPTLPEHPMYERFKMLGLGPLGAMSNGAMTPEMLAAAEADLAAIEAD